MKTRRSVSSVLGIFIIALVAMPVRATTLIRAGLDELKAANSTIVLAEVADTHSYWNQDGTFILTDLRVLAHESLKGSKRAGSEFTVTIMGGTVGDLTTLIIGGPDLVPGKRYVLFLNEERLPGASAVLTVRDQSQGIFDVVRADRGFRAVSQASRHPLFPDVRGESRAPGGSEGIPLDELLQTLRGQGARK